MLEVSGTSWSPSWSLKKWLAMLCNCHDNPAWVVREQAPKAGTHFPTCGSGRDSLIFVVPGHHAFAWTSELHLLQIELRQLLPEAEILISKAGEANQSLHPGKKLDAALKQQDLDAAALELADEVCVALDATQETRRVSFLAIGTGGLIVRAAVSWFGQNARERLMTFLSLSTPHLGLWLPDFSWTQSLKFWTLRRFSGCPLWLEQITHKDGRRAEGSRLHRLCECENAFQFFKRVIFVGSKDDLVPVSSSLLNINKISISQQTDLRDPREPHAVLEVSRAKVLIFAMPFLWLVRLRAWTALLLTVSLVFLTFLWTPPFGAVKKHVAKVKATLNDVILTIQHFQGSSSPHFQQTLASTLLELLPHERLLRVEVKGAGSWTWKTWVAKISLWPRVLCEADSIKCVVEGYGAYLSPWHGWDPGIWDPPLWKTEKTRGWLRFPGIHCPHCQSRNGFATSCVYNSHFFYATDDSYDSNPQR